MPAVMQKSKIVQQLRELNVIERLNIITDMWDEIKESRRELEFVSNEEKGLLLNRLADYRSNPGSAKDWTNLKQEVCERYNKEN